MIDLVCSTLDEEIDPQVKRASKRAAFLAIIDEEADAGRCSAGLLATLREEIVARLG